MRSKLENLFFTVLVVLLLAFVGRELQAAWQAFLYPQAGEGPHLRPAPEPTGEGHPEERGRLVFQAQGCLACHNLDLTGSVLAPSLDNVGIRRTARWLRTKLLDPHAKLPATFMPAYTHLSDADLEALVAFLRTLTPTRSGPDNTGEARIEIPTDEQGRPRFTPDQVERGKLLFQQQGCIGCHTINGIYPGGPVGPNLTHEAQRRRSDEWQLRHLLNPVSVYVIGEAKGTSWIMPSYEKLPREDLEALVAFLQSLK